MTIKSNIFGDLPKKPIKQTIEDNRLVERVKDENLYPFKRGSFETYEEFRKRLTDSFQYNISIGIATLDDKNYNVETKKFFLNIEYLKWFKLLCVLETNNRFYIQIEPHEAKSLYYDYEQYELVVRFEIDYKNGISVNMDDKLKVHIKDIWLVARAKNSLNHNGFKFLVKDIIREEIDKKTKAKEKEKLKQEADNNAWMEALENNTKVSYETYLKNNSNGTHVNEAKARIDSIMQKEHKKLAEIEEKKQLQREYDMWELVKKEKNVKAYKRYLDLYPNSPHNLYSQDITQRLNKIYNRREAIKEIFKVWLGGTFIVSVFFIANAGVNEGIAYSILSSIIIFFVAILGK